jgi:hypothetical protein
VKPPRLKPLTIHVPEHCLLRPPSRDLAGRSRRLPSRPHRNRRSTPHQWDENVLRSLGVEFHPHSDFVTFVFPEVPDDVKESTIPQFRGRKSVADWF